MAEGFWKFVKENKISFILVIGALFIAAGAVGKIPTGANPPLDSMDITGRIAFWIAGGITFIFGFLFFRLDTARPRGAFIVPVYPRHRITAHDFYEHAFSSGEEVLYLSIMSESTLKEMEPRLQQAQATRTTLQVLTLDPDLPAETIETIRRHLNENTDNPFETTNQIKRAWEHWTTVKSKYQNVQVRKYKSVPTLQIIIVGNKYAIIELLPYDTHPRERPGLVVTLKDNPELFKLFQEKYLRLWKDAVQ